MPVVKAHVIGVRETPGIPVDHELVGTLVVTLVVVRRAVHEQHLGLGGHSVPATTTGRVVCRNRPVTGEM